MEKGKKRRSTGKKRTGKKRSRKAKVSLKNTSVAMLGCIILVLCGLLLLLNFVFSGSDNKKENTNKDSGYAFTQMDDTLKIKIPDSPEKSSEDKKNTSEKSAEEKKTNSVMPDDRIKTEKSPVELGITSDKVRNNTESSINKAKIKTEEKVASVKTPDAPKPPVSKFNIPQAAKGATLVFVIDDAGGNLENLRKYASLPFPLTIAVLPKLAHSKDCAYVSRISGKEVILHQPMQSLNLNINPGPGAITADMGTYDIARVIKENLDELGYGVKGLNNHEGSLITSDQIKIGAVLEVCQEKNIYFLDSRTTADTKAPMAALERDMRIFEKNAPYIDNVISRDAMLKEIYGCLEVANKKGRAIMIGHVDKSVKILPDLLREMYPELVKKGYKFATPSALP